MSTVPLPEQPDLAQLRKQARELQRSVRDGDPGALATVAEFHPHPPAATAFPLTAAQTVLARRYGFPSWARLGRHVRVLAERTWTCTDAPAHEPVADRFLRLACLNFDHDDPAHRIEAAALLAAHPELPSDNVAVAAACADVPRLRALLAENPGAATTSTGPYGWSPLLYQAYARHDMGVGRVETLAAARLLLDNGADPNDGRFFRGLPTPFTVLTGVFAGNWDGQPAHPHAIPLARLLLQRGADPNDGQTLYNRMFGTADDHLELLLEFGLGTETGGPWHRLLGDQLESPHVMLSSLLEWAVAHDQGDRVALLAGHLDVTQPITVPRRSSTSARTPVEIATLNGNRELATQLRGYGAAEPRLDAVATFVADAFAGSADVVRATPADVVAKARAARPGLIVWAAARHRIDTVTLLLEAGFDVNALGRSDTPVEGDWHTALHVAARDGDLELARLLLANGADPAIRDKHYGTTPVVWAAHFGQRAVVELLRQSPPGVPNSAVAKSG